MVKVFTPPTYPGCTVISVELLKGFLDVSVQYFYGIPARFVDLSVIKKGHTFINILALIHDIKTNSFSTVRTTQEGFDSLLFLLGDVASVSLLVFVGLQNLLCFW